jgi:hypothetical protein
MERLRGGTKGRDRNRDRGKYTEYIQKRYRQRVKETQEKRQREEIEGELE